MIHTKQSLLALIELAPADLNEPWDNAQAESEGWYVEKGASISSRGRSWVDAVTGTIIPRALEGSDYHVTALRRIVHCNGAGPVIRDWLSQGDEE